MKTYAVAYISFFDNALDLKVVEANGWKEALEEALQDELYYLSDDIEEAKTEAFNSDWTFNVIQIKNKQGEICLSKD